MSCTKHFLSVIWNPLDNTMLAHNNVFISGPLYHEIGGKWAEYPQTTDKNGIFDATYFPHNKAIALRKPLYIELIAAKNLAQWNPMIKIEKSSRIRFMKERPSSAMISLVTAPVLSNTYTIEIGEQQSKNSWSPIAILKTPLFKAHENPLLWNHNGMLAAIIADATDTTIRIYQFSGNTIPFNQLLLLSIIKYLSETPEGQKQLQDNKKLLAPVLVTFSKGLQLDWAYELLK